MKRFISIIACLLVCSIASIKLSAQTQTSNGNNGYDVFVPIAKYIGQGNVDNLSAWFADNLEISIISSSNNSSKNQAKQILKSFFESYNPRSFDITHTASKTRMKYATGSLNAGGERFNVTIFVNYSDDTYKIQQLKIDRIQ